jgi:hypothetical protein
MQLAEYLFIIILYVYNILQIKKKCIKIQFKYTTHYTLFLKIGHGILLRAALSH